jgi:hypothetical protein
MCGLHSGGDRLSGVIADMLGDAVKVQVGGMSFKLCVCCLVWCGVVRGAGVVSGAAGDTLPAQ